tara:strand:+ start:632 stop:1759 length:1128 start_codon:yes stop_codon:yes gene_type:complete
MNKLNITYVFGSGRKDKLLHKNYKAKEFFYGVDHFIDKGNNVEIIEMSKEQSEVKGFKNILRIIDKILRKVSNLPFYFTEILSVENFKKLTKTDKLIITNDRLALSVLPFLLLIKTYKKIEIYVIVMGLFSKKKDTFVIKTIQNFLIKILLKISKNLIFLGKGEITFAENTFSRYSEKFKFLPFSVDTSFWGEEDIDATLNKKILFIGNDGNRDYELFLKIAESYPEISFTCITNNINNSQVPKNCELISGNWNESLLSDDEIRNYYIDSRIVIIPLKETFQPSGQSVSLQSMSVGIPVFISQTKGFWDTDLFSNRKNIVFVDDNSLDGWKKTIDSIYHDNETLNNLSKNAKATISKNLNLNTFNTRLENILNIM